MTLICVTLAEKRMEDNLSHLGKCISGGAGLVEIRLDHLEQPEVSAGDISMIRKKGLGSIITLRPTWEGGTYVGSEEERVKILKEALRAGPDYIDIELGMMTGHSTALRKEAKSRGARLIVSHHDWEDTPSENIIASRMDSCTNKGADISKIVLRSGSLDDFLTLVKMGSKIKGNGFRYCLMGTGPYGHLSRIFSREIGSELVYCCLEEPVAEGQLSINHLDIIWKHMAGGTVPE